ncbi:thioredoxin fold domain containing protein [Pseudohyphozyma bogoriensis]|nr:thioredoxin fold domain containing protein [Pseudohyphozyma bogoriensis]
MSSEQPIIFYDLVTAPGGSFFSPFTMTARLALLNKGVPFEVKELTYGTLRSEWCGLDKPLHVKDATVPFIRKLDGTYLMDSAKIIEWLDTTYPDTPNTYLPEASLPVDVSSSAYQSAVQEASRVTKNLFSNRTIFCLYAPRAVKLMSKSDHDYFISPARMGTGSWESVLERSADREKLISQGKDWTAAVERELGDKQWFASETAPGYVDFYIRVPFIRKPDGTYLIDSLKIIEWVDESYPDRPNTYLPEAPLPVDTTSPAYKEVVSKALLFYKTIPTWAPIFYIYAPTIISYLNQQDLAHFTAWEPGEWEKVLEEAKDRKSVMTNAKKWANALEEALGDKDFFASKTAPGYTDFEIMGRYQMGRVDGAAMQEIFAGKLGAWLDRMNTRFAEGLKEVRARDVPF